MSVDPSIRAQVMEILSDPMSLPPEFWGYDVQNWMKEAPVFPISQVFGYSLTTPHRAVVLAVETTTSTTYTDLATAGPTLSNLPNGTYLVLVQATMSVSVATDAALMGPAVNGVVISDADCAISEATNPTSCIGISLQTLNAGSNTLQAKYRVSGLDTGTFFYRNLVAIKVANL